MYEQMARKGGFEFIDRMDLEPLSDDAMPIRIFAPDISVAIICVDNSMEASEEEKGALFSLYKECLQQTHANEYAFPFCDTHVGNVRPLFSFFWRLPFDITMLVRTEKKGNLA